MTSVGEIFLKELYPEENELRRLLVAHSRAVQRKAFEILDAAPEEVRVQVDRELTGEGALVHDLGIRFCHAPSLFCFGDAPYLAHGVLGAEWLRAAARRRGMDGEALARICERHTGSGLTAGEVIRASCGAWMPVRDYLPETPEEKLICLADKFFSKSGAPSREKTLSEIRGGMARFGAGTSARFEALVGFFGLRDAGAEPAI